MKALYLWIGAAVALLVGIVWCFQNGPCAGSTSSANKPGSGLSGVLSAASQALKNNEQTLVDGGGNPLANVQGGIDNAITSVTDWFSGGNVNTD